jgi:predicted pyridoxine 5'-phosphate oxidase superfamily flavin-nucleotide-binding protein
MSRQHFAEIIATQSVKEAQLHYNGHELLTIPTTDTPVRLGTREREYIAERDSFYLATVSETGWPHVQHRGGPAGFLKVLADDLLGFADYRGNRQYVSVGNLKHNDKAAFILMDYPNRRRLKILGRVEIVDMVDASPELIATILPPLIQIAVERILLIKVVAFDWNCSQQISPRYTKSEMLSLNQT